MFIIKFPLGVGEETLKGSIAKALNLIPLINTKTVHSCLPNPVIIQTVESRTPLLLPLYSTGSTVGMKEEGMLMKNSINAKMLANFVSRGVFLFNPNFRKFCLESKSNRPFWFGLAGIFEHLWRWSTLDCPTGMTEMTLYIWHNCCPRYCSSVPCLQAPTKTRSGLGQVCTTGMYCTIGCMEFPKFQAIIFVEWNAP